MTALAALYLPQMRMDFETIEGRARTAEEAGYHSIWFMDHMAPPAGKGLDCLEAFTVATAVAMRTTRLRVGHLVLCSEFRHPVLLAKMAASLDVISEGRLELGLGWGSVDEEMRDFGFGDFTKAQRSARLAETLEILDLLFTGEPVDFDGEHWTLRDAMCRPTTHAAVVSRCTSVGWGSGSRCRSSPATPTGGTARRTRNERFDDAARARRGAPASRCNTRSVSPARARRNATRWSSSRGGGSVRGVGGGGHRRRGDRGRSVPNATPAPSCSSASSTTSARPRRIRLFADEVLPALH